MYPSGSVPILQQEVAAFIATANGLRPAPDQLRMHISVADIVRIAESLYDLRASISSHMAFITIPSFIRCLP